MAQFGLSLAEYPWEQLTPYRAIAREYPGGLVDLSIGTPVDPTPEPVQAALIKAANAPGYPTTAGTGQVREAIVDWFARRRGVPGLSPSQVMPTVGSKELVAWLPFLLGLGEGDLVLRPTAAYPTYDMGAILAGADHRAADTLEGLESDTLARVKLIWVNSPANPTGIVRSVDQLKRLVDGARDIGAVVASDECYAELGWGAWDRQRGGEPVPSLLDPRVSGGSQDLLLTTYSLSKQSNLAGYRAAFLAGDPEIMANLLNSRKQAGMIVPAPVQAAMVAALTDSAHVEEQKDRYRARRARLIPALKEFGLTVEHSEAGLYLWATAGEDCWVTVQRFADRGILVGPGAFYGDAGKKHIRVSLTGSDTDIAAVCDRVVP